MCPLIIVLSSSNKSFPLPYLPEILNHSWRPTKTQVSVVNAQMGRQGRRGQAHRRAHFLMRPSCSLVWSKCFSSCFSPTLTGCHVLDNLVFTSWISERGLFGPLCVCVSKLEFSVLSQLSFFKKILTESEKKKYSSEVHPEKVNTREHDSQNRNIIPLSLSRHGAYETQTLCNFHSGT